MDRVPLTLEDVLHPKEDDVIPERPLQEQARGDLARIFRSRLPQDTWLVLSDCIVDWGVPGIGNHSPDVSVFADLKVRPDPERGTFHLKPSGGRCVLAIEVVSPDSRATDVERKFQEYYEVGVPLYVMVDKQRESLPRRLLGYRHTPQGYAPVPPDEYGRLPLEPLGLSLGLRDEQVMCYDAATGEELGDYAQVDQGRRAAEQRVKDLEEELRRLRGNTAP
jgi:Uma2 family endonuclease